MDRSDLLEAEQIPARPITWFHTLSIDPAGSIGVPLDLRVLAPLLGPDRAALVQEFAHLVEDERVALERGGMVSLLVPQLVPDVFSLRGVREAAEAGVEILDGFVKPGVDHRSRGSPRWSSGIARCGVRPIIVPTRRSAQSDRQLTKGLPINYHSI